MFDGNHRTRRNINLSSSTKRSSRHRLGNRRSTTATGGTSSTSSILDEARRSREKRLLIAKRNKAAISVQRIWRGHIARLHFAKSLLGLLFHENGDAKKDSNEDAYDNHQILDRMWKALSGLLMPSVVSLIVPSYLAIQNYRHQNSSSKRDGSNDKKLQIQIIAQFIAKLQQSLSPSTTGFINATFNSKSSEKQSKIILYRRILHHTLLFFNSFLKSQIQVQKLAHDKSQYTNNVLVQNDGKGEKRHERESTISYNSQQQEQQQIALTLLNFITILFQKDEILQKVIPITSIDDKTKSHEMNKSQTNILHVFTTCCQAYYDTLGQQPYNENMLQSSDNIHSILYKITMQLMKLACHSIPLPILPMSTSSSTTAVSMKYLAAILLGIDLQHCIQIDNESNAVTNINVSSTSMYSIPVSTSSTQSSTTTISYSQIIFHECAKYLFPNNSPATSTNISVSTMKRNEINCELVRLLLNSLDANAESKMNDINSASSMATTNHNTHHNQRFTQKTLISKLMSGHEVMYIKNAFGLLDIAKNNEHKLRNGNSDYKTLCSAVIHLLAMLLGIGPEMGSAFKAISFKKGVVLASNTDNFELSNHSHALNILIGLIAKGESMTINKKKQETDNHDENYDMEVDEDGVLDEEYEHQENQQETTQIRPTKSPKSNNYNRRTKTSQQRRQDLQTISKLDQLYQSKVNHTRHDLNKFFENSLRNKNETLLHIANIIGSGGLILEWAFVLFPPPTIRKRKITMDTNDNKNTKYTATMETQYVKDLEFAQDTFISILSMTLSYCTGIKSRSCAMSPILSKLAFQSNFMEQFWQYVKTQLEILDHEKNQLRYSQQSVKAFSAASSFCDLFVHHLLAMDDEEFLLSYTVSKHNEKPRSSILATELIDVLKNNLYALYWSRPVFVDDVMLPLHVINAPIEQREGCQRARFLLSGTKLWNALHQRWSRLFTSAKFCEKECWYFPRLVTRGKDEDGAVFDTRTEGFQDVDMSDGEDSTTSMDIDNGDRGKSMAIDVENDALASSFKDPKMARILTSIPQAIPFDRRVKLFSSLLAADLARAQDETQAARNMMLSMLHGEEGAEFQGRIQANIHRDQLYEDSMKQLSKLGPKLRKKVSVTFTSQVGAVEAGIDGGGVFREFLDDLIKEAFSPEKSHGTFGPLFTESPLQTLSVNTRLPPTREVLTHYKFLGQVLGKAVYETLLVEPQFSYPFLNQLLGQQNTLDDLKNLDPEYYKHLSMLRHMNHKEIEELGLTFELSIQRTDGSIKSQTLELIPGGSQINVTKENAIRYVHLVAHRRLNIETSKQTNAFLLGFRDLIPAAWVRLFSPYELQRLISGDDTVKGFDVSGLKEAMQYAGGFHPSQPIMQWFWEIVEEMTADQQRKLLKFMTSCSRQPLLGFKSLAPLPCVHQVRLNEEEYGTDGKEVKLPTSATCMNLLKLPNYRSKALMKAKLLYAIESGAGFELS